MYDFDNFAFKGPHDNNGICIPDISQEYLRGETAIIAHINSRVGRRTGNFFGNGSADEQVPLADRSVTICEKDFNAWMPVGLRDGQDKFVFVRVVELRQQVEIPPHSPWKNFQAKHPLFEPTNVTKDVFALTFKIFTTVSTRKLHPTEATHNTDRNRSLENGVIEPTFEIVDAVAEYEPKLVMGEGVNLRDLNDFLSRVFIILEARGVRICVREMIDDLFEFKSVHLCSLNL